MTSFDDLIPPNIRSLQGYIPGKPLSAAQAESGVTCIKMASNENPYGPSPAAVAAMHDAALRSHLYPDDTNTELRAHLAGMHGLTRDEVLVSDGSTSFLDIIARTLLGPGLNAVTSERSFIIYPLVTKLAGGTLIQAPMRNDAFDLEAILGAIDRNTRIVFIANPNNPTGTMFDAKATDRFLDRVPPDVLVVLDEAYCDYAEFYARHAGIEYSHSLDYVKQNRNVVVLRTMSKAHGLAGLRVGYGFAPRRVLQYFVRVRTPFSVSAISEAAALAAIEDRDHIRRSVEANAEGVAVLNAGLRELGLRFIPTCTNFIYFDVDEDAAAVSARLQAEGIIVRPLGPWGCPRSLRVSVGTPSQNQRFLVALKHALDRVPA
jgi:histidinol-phosphate aminotransferase